MENPVLVGKGNACVKFKVFSNEGLGCEWSYQSFTFASHIMYMLCIDKQTVVSDSDVTLKKYVVATWTNKY